MFVYFNSSRSQFSNNIKIVCNFYFFKFHYQDFKARLKFNLRTKHRQLIKRKRERGIKNKKLMISCDAGKT